MLLFFKILLLSLFLLLIAFLGFGIKLLFDKNATFKGGTCSSCSCSEENNESCELK